MIKSAVGALVGEVVLGLMLPGVGVLLEWIEPGYFLFVAGVSALLGAVLGWLRPGLFLRSVLFFIDRTSLTEPGDLVLPMLSSPRRGPHLRPRR